MMVAILVGEKLILSQQHWCLLVLFLLELALDFLLISRVMFPGLNWKKLEYICPCLFLQSFTYN